MEIGGGGIVGCAPAQILRASHGKLRSQISHARLPQSSRFAGRGVVRAVADGNVFESALPKESVGKGVDMMNVSGAQMEVVLPNSNGEVQLPVTKPLVNIAHHLCTEINNGHRENIRESGRSKAAVVEDTKQNLLQDPRQLWRTNVKKEKLVAPLMAPQEENVNQDDGRYMIQALKEAQKAAMAGEVPVGAVIVHQGKIIARAYNKVEAEGDPTAHAEILCIRSATRQLGGWRLLDCAIYITLEPCAMCAGAILQARVGQVVWGAPNTLLGADGSWISLFPKACEDEQGGVRKISNLKSEPQLEPPTHPFNPKIVVRRGVLSDDCSTIMRTFFRARRQTTSIMGSNMRNKYLNPSLVDLICKRLSNVWALLRHFVY